MPGISIYSLRSRLIFLVSTALIPVALLMLITAIQERRTAIEELREEICLQARLAAVNEQQLIDGTRQLLVALSTAPLVRGDPAGCNKFLAGLLKKFHRYTNFGLLAHDGSLICSAVPYASPLSAAGRLFFNNAVKYRDFSVGDYQTGRITGKPSIHFGYPVFDENDSLEAVLYAALDLDWLYMIGYGIEKKFPEGSQICKIDRNGVVLASNAERFPVGKPLPVEQWLIDSLRAQKSGSVEVTGPAGEVNLYSFAAIGSPLFKEEIYFIVELPRKTLLKKIDQRFALNLGLLGLVALLTLSVTWLGGRTSILKPVHLLQKSAERIAGGDLGTRTGLSAAKGEFGLLARSFDSMAEALQQRQAEAARAEERLRRSEASLAEAQRIARLGSWEFNIATNESVRSEGVFRIFKTNPREFGATFEDFLAFVHPEDRNFVEKTINEARREKKPYSIEYRIINGAGEILFLRDEGEVIVDESGAPVIMIGYCQDITRQKEAGEALRTSEERFRLLAENAKDLIFRYRFLPERGYEYVSPAATEMTGYSPEEHYADPDLADKLIYPEDRKLMEKIRNDPLSHYKVTLRWIHKNGNIFWAELQYSCNLDLAGNLLSIDGVVRDITERKEAVGKIKRSREELRKLSRYLQEVREEERKYIAREIHDDLGGILTSLKIELGLLSDEIPEKPASLIEQIDSMSGIIDQGIADVKDITGKLRPPLLDDLGLIPALEVHAREFQAHSGILCKLEFPPGELEVDSNTAIALYRVYQEALTNIARHASATRIKISLKKSGASLEFKISDNGAGILKEKIQAPTSFGLINMRERLRDLGGALEIHGRKGRGTTIAATLPVNDENSK